VIGSAVVYVDGMHRTRLSLSYLTERRARG
jgi:hypothetical protein